MLVDDDEDDRQFFLDVIDALQPALACVTASNGREALNILVTGEIVPELIFLDLNMPLMNGWQFLAEIKKFEPLKHIPITILSTSSDTQTKEDTKRLGAQFFITKPDRISSWEEVLKRFFDDWGDH